MDYFEWARRMQDNHAVSHYNSYFEEESDVNILKIMELEDIAELADDGDAKEILKWFDYSGLDLVAFGEDGELIIISQRIRMYRGKDNTTDFSFRHTTGGNNPAELKKLNQNFNYKYGTLPKLYGFGIADVHHEEKDAKRKGINRGLRYFAIYDLVPLLDAYFSGDIYHHSQTMNGDGTGGLYIHLDDIEQFKLYSWGNVHKPKKNSKQSKTDEWI